MKITSFNPQIITKDVQAIAQLFEDLGFEKRHNPTGIGDLNVEGIRMKDANGFYLDISHPEIRLPQDMIVIRVNVDDFEEAYQLLLSKGFTNFYGNRTVETNNAISAMMVSPSGFAINLMQHIKQ